MNKMKCLLAAIVALVIMAGCGKKVDVAFTATTIAIAPEGESVKVELTSNGEWTVGAYPEWMVVSPTSGNGDATLTLSVAPNDSEASRSGEVRVSSKDNTTSLTVTQEAMEEEEDYFIEVSPESIDSEFDGGTFILTVTSNSDWTVSVPANWISCEPMSGNGNGTVSVTIAPIEGDVETRESDISFDGVGSESLLIHVVQHAQVHVYVNIEPNIIQLGYDGGTQNVAVTSSGDWTATPDSDWITVSSNSGNGDTDLTVMVAENEAVLEPREGRVSFVSETGDNASLVVKQEGAAPVVSVIPDTLFASYTGGFQYLSITANTSWNLETSDGWITLMTSSGEGNAEITIIVDLNNSDLERVGVISVKHGSQTMARAVIVQEGRPSILETDVVEINARPEGGEYTIHVTSNQIWNIETSVDWLVCTPSSGHNDGEFVVKVEPLSTIQPRSTELRIYGNYGSNLIIPVSQSH